MADYKKLVPIIKQWEGGFVNNPNDSGGATNKGVTLATFRSFYGNNKTVEDLKKISDDQWLYIFLTGYWNKLNAGQINNQSVANILVDWGWGSGPATAAKKVQAIVGTDTDGIIGPKTLEAINSANPKSLFDKIKAARLKFVEDLVKARPKDKEFMQGWKNRINSFFFSESAPAVNAFSNYGLLAGAAVFVLLLISKKWK